MSKICQISYKKANNACAISHSHIKTKKLQHVNLQNKKIWSKKKSCWIKICVSAKVLKMRHKINI